MMLLMLGGSSAGAVSLLSVVFPICCAYSLIILVPFCLWLLSSDDSEGHRIHITTSVGIARFPDHGKDAHAVIKNADTAMYQAKANGRNSYRYFSVGMQQLAEDRFRRQKSLREAIEKRQLILHYQAQSDGEGKVVGAEALMRWRHSERGLLGPLELIPAAEETGQIAPIAEWALQLALKQLGDWLDSVPDLPFRSISVNVSPVQFRQRDFVERLERILAASGLPPYYLNLELTESLLLDGIEQTTDKIQRLNKLGVRFSLDDSGTGYSSLSYLRNLPIDVVKIDRSFVRNIVHDPNDAKMVETILSLTSHLVKTAVAEGVETQAQMDLLRRWGCERFQGFHIHRPESGDALLERLRVNPCLLTPREPSFAGTVSTAKMRPA